MDKKLIATDREWTKIKVKDFGIETEYKETKTYEDLNGNKSSETVDIVCKHSGMVHDDFRNALNALAPHLLCLTEWADHPESVPELLLDQITITGISLGGSEEFAGVTITGKKVLKTGKVFNMNSPFMMFEEASNENNPGYRWSWQVSELCDTVQAEVELFMRGKRLPDPQLEFDFPANVEVTLKAVTHE